MIKKIISVILIATMAISLAACADKNSKENSDPDKMVVESVEASVEEKAPANVETSTDEGKDIETSASVSLEEVASTETVSKESVNVFGTTGVDTYTNEFFGFKVEAPKGYSFADDAAIAALGMTSTERIKSNNESIGGTMEYALNSGLVATDFYLYAPGGLGTMNLTISSSALGIKDGQEEVFIDAMMPTLVETYEAAGLSDVSVERSTTTCMDKEVPCIVASGVLATESMNIDMYIIQIPMIKDGYMANITAGTYMTDTVTDLIALISAVE